MNSIDYIENPSVKPSKAGRKVTAFLRWAGTIILAVSAISFLLQGLEDYVPGYRNWIISGFIVVLCGCGLICGYLMKETRGARLFFGLATAFLTVEFSQIATLIYQYMVPVTDQLHAAPTWWRVDRMSVSMFASVVVAGLVLTALVVPTGFSMLARTKARKLSWGFLAGNALLMFPSRDNFFMALVLVLVFGGLRVLSRRSLAEDPVLRTQEGIAGLAIMWIPAAIIGARGFFYPESWSMLCAVLAIGAVVLLLDIRSIMQSVWVGFFAQLFGTLSAIFAWLILAQEAAYRNPFLHGYEVLWVLLPTAFVLHLVSETSENQGSKYRAGAGLIAGYATLEFLISNPGTVASFACILTGIALTATGMANKEKWPFLSGVVCFGSGILFNLTFALDIYQAFPWASSAALGLLVLLLASYIDSRERIFLQKTWHAYQALKSWG